MKKNKPIGSLPLSTLIEMLEAEGFHIGIGLRMQLQQVLKTFRDEIVKGDLDNLRLYIRPLICKSHNQQIVFDNAFGKYKRYIEERTSTFSERLSEPLIGKTKRRIVSLRPLWWAASILLILLILLQINKMRDAPDVRSLPSTEWIRPGDSLRLHGLFNGKLIAGSFRSDDSLLHSQNFYYATNDTLQAKLLFKDTGQHLVTLHALNLLTEKSASDTIEVIVCGDKPVIERIDTLVDPTQPLLVSFQPKVSSAMDLELIWKVDGDSVWMGDTYEHPFEESGEYLIELIARQSGKQSTICNTTHRTMKLRLKSVILGDKKLLDRTADTSTSGKLSPENRERVLRVGIIPYKNPQALDETFIPLFEAVVQQLDGFDQLELQRVTAEKLPFLLADGQIDIGISTVVPYLNLVRESDSLKLQLSAFATHVIEDRSFYQGYILRHKGDEDINSLADFKGRGFTFVKPSSTSGYRIPKGIMRTHGLFPVDEDTLSYDFSEDHTKSIEHLLAGKTDGIAIDESRYLKSPYKDSLEIIQEFEVPYNAYLLSPALRKRTKDSIRQVMLDSTRSLPTNTLGIQKWITINDAHYDQLRKDLSGGSEQYFDLLDMQAWKRSSISERLILIVSLLGLLGLTVGFLEYRFRNRKLRPSAELAPVLESGATGPFQMNLPNQNSLIRPEKELYDLTMRMKQRTDAGVLRLDLQRTIKGTIEHAGFTKLQFREITKVPEYLVIINKSSSEDLHVNLFRFLNDFLQHEDTHVDTFYFNKDIRHLHNHKHPEGISLEEVHEKYPDHVLLILSDGYRMINSKLDRVFRWALNEVIKWPRRFLLTPNSFSEWGRKEELVDGMIPIVPASIKSLVYLSEILNLKQAPPISDRIRDLQLSGDTQLMDLRSIEGIQAYLAHPGLFQWFCCLAIYPKLHWQLVVAMGRAISRHYENSEQEFVVNYESLYKISELSRRIEHDFDDELRTELMKSLNSQVERVARRILLRLLNDLDVPRDSYLHREISVQTRINEALLNKDDPQAVSDLYFLWEENQMEDDAVKAYLSESDNTLLEKKAGDHFRYVNQHHWVHTVKRLPAYVLASLFFLLILNIAVLPNFFDPFYPLFEAKGVGQADSTTQVNRTAFRYNQAVDSYNSGREQEALRMQDSILVKNDTLDVAQGNRYTILFNAGVDNYLGGNLEQAAGKFQEVSYLSEAGDELRLDALHYLGLCLFYQDNLLQAKVTLEALLKEAPNFLSKVSPNLATLLKSEIENNIVSEIDNSLDSILIAAEKTKDSLQAITKTATTDLRSGLVAFYPLNGSAQDASGNGNHGVVKGAQESTDRFGYVNGSYHFNGRSYIEIPNDPSLNLLNNYSLSAWIKIDQFDGRLKGILSKYHRPSANGFVFRTSINKPYRKINFDGTETQVYANANTWYHLVAINDKGRRRLFVNGNETSLEGSPDRGIPSANQDPIIIGADYLYGQDPRFFKGNIDDVRIYDRILSKVEINTLYRKNEWSESSLSAKKSKRPSPPAKAIGYINGVEIEIDYSQHAKRGRKLFGDDGLYQYGAVWRTGANESSWIQFSRDVNIEGNVLAAGKYGLFSIPGENEWIIILNEVWDKWGAFSYREEDDVLRVPVKPRKSKLFAERLTIVVDEQEGAIILRWDDLEVPIRLYKTIDELLVYNEHYLTNIEEEVTEKGNRSADRTVLLVAQDAHRHALNMVDELNLFEQENFFESTDNLFGTSVEDALVEWEKTRDDPFAVLEKVRFPDILTNAEGDMYAQQLKVLQWEAEVLDAYASMVGARRP